MPISIFSLARTALLAAILAAQAPAASAENLSGAYLAGMQADFRDEYAVAAGYYERALRHDPENLGLMQNAIVAQVALGDISAALELAEKLSAEVPEHQLATLVRLSDALASKNFDAALEILEGAGPSLNALLGGLVSGWIEVGRGDFDAAQARFDAMDANPGLTAYGQYHKALALALAGDFVTAEEILAGGDDGPLHVNRAALLAHAQILAQIAREDDAIAILDETLSGGYPDAMILDLRDRLSAGEEVVFDQVAEASDGAAEAYLTLAEALNGQDSERIALLNANLAAHIRPGLVEARLLAAGVLEDQDQFELATEALSGIPETSPWFVTSEIRRAETQREAGEVDAGIVTLTALGESHPDQIEVHSALGDALRSAERYQEAAHAYGRAVELVGTPQQIHWVLYYTRGIANERSDNWDAAEADFRQALELQPDQPLVLNYLGYSLVEKGRDLDEALDMIERAVKGQQDDGYITDSLGWVLYRLGRYEEAVPHMLRAVELVPDDPVINDHVGDVLWKVGRHREAEFQWRRALSFGPADDLDMDLIRTKIEKGMEYIPDSGPADSDG